MIDPIEPAELLQPDVFAERFEYLEELIQGQSAILEMISRGDELKDILDAIVLWAEKESGDGLLASILLTNYNGERLLHGAAPSLPEDYNNAIHGVSIGPAIGSCGTAAFTKELVVAADIGTDPRWADFKDLAFRYGLRACWSSPLVTKKGEVLGTFAMYYTKPKSPSKHDLQIIRLITNTTVIAIQWTRARQERITLLENERRSHHKAVEERKQFYNLLMNAPAMMAVLKGPEHVYELANPLYMKAIGERDIIGKTIREALPELEGQGIYELLDNVYHTNQPYYGNELMILLDKSGDNRMESAYFNFIYHPIRNELGITEGIFVHAVDVTELVLQRKRAEESEQRFKSFVLNSPMPIGIYEGREMRIQTANDAVLKAWEKDRSVVGKTFREALPELEGQPFYDILDNVYLTGVPYEAFEERVNLMRNGRIAPTYWNFSYTPLRNANGEIYGVMNTAAEVTELVQAKQQLLATEEALLSAIEIAELGTWQIHLDDQAVTYSPQIARWFGLPETGAGLDTVLSRIDDTYRETVEKSLRHALDTNGIYEAEYKVSNPQKGRERILHAKGRVVLDENGKQVAITGICRDTTLQHETEKELAKLVEKRTIELQKANDNLNSLNENLKQFVYVASHDLQEPLRKINMFSEMLRSKAGSELDPHSSKYLSKISRSAGRMTALIRDLLDFSRAESQGKESQPVDLDVVVNNVIEDYEMMVQQKAANISICPLPRVQATALQMNQLFYNLIGNALKFSASGRQPVIGISARELSPAEVSGFERLDAGTAYAEIVVRDNGIGFDARFAEQIFVIFQRLHGKDEYEGTGIGLALCRKIVENHNGLIYADSKPDAGAAFHVILPLSGGQN